MKVLFSIAAFLISVANGNAISMMQVEDIRNPDIQYRSEEGDNQAYQLFPGFIAAAMVEPFLGLNFVIQNADAHQPRQNAQLEATSGENIANVVQYKRESSFGNLHRFSDPFMQWNSPEWHVLDEEKDKRGDPLTGAALLFEIRVDANQIDDDSAESDTFTWNEEVFLAQDIPARPIAKGVDARVLMGKAFDAWGPAAMPASTNSATPVVVDFEVDRFSSLAFNVTMGFDTAFFFVYEGELTRINDKPYWIPQGSLVHLDATSWNERGVGFETGGVGCKLLFFSGKKAPKGTQEKENVDLGLSAGYSLEAQATWIDQITLVETPGPEVVSLLVKDIVGESE